MVDEKNVVYRSAYIDSPNTPRFAFGHGMSYTDFAYSALRVSSKSMAPGGNITLSFTLANTGKRAGEEVVQLYLRDLVATTVRPIKELKGFQKIRLEPGEQRTVSFKIDEAMLSYFNRKLEWKAEPGEFKLMVGGASDAVRLETIIKLDGEPVP